MGTLTPSADARASRALRFDSGIGILGGFVATLAMTVVLYLAMPLLGGDPAMARRMAETVGIGMAAGLIIHFLLGTFVFPRAYILLYEKVPGRSWMKGVVWGAGLWLLAEVLVIPILGGGLFHAKWSGFTGAFVFLIAHLLYGGALGAIIRASEPDDVPS